MSLNRLTPHPTGASGERAATRRRALVRFLALVALLAGGMLLLRLTPLSTRLTREELVALFERLGDPSWSPLAFLGLYLVIAPLGLPVSPFVLAGGAVFGRLAGTLLNFAGVYLGAALTFALARTLGRSFLIELAGERRIARAERRLARHGFWPLVQIRFVPIPSSVVNVAAALVGVRWPAFLASSALGLAPAVFVYTLFGATLLGLAAEGQRGAARNLVLALLALALLAALPQLARAWRRRRRYRALRASRSARKDCRD